MPNAHLKGHGCEQCSFELISIAKRSSKEEFIEHANKVHGLKYDYTNIEYTNAKTEIKIGCKQHGNFNQTPDSHLRGSGCPGCAEYGFNTDLPAILYYLKIKHVDSYFFKIGITNNDVTSRFRKGALDKIVDYIEMEFKKGKDALIIEQSILKNHKNYINTNREILKDGNTEIFTKDILDFDLLKKKGKALLKNYLK